MYMCSAQTGFSISNKDEKSTAVGGFLKHKTENTAGFLKHKCLEKWNNASSSTPVEKEEFAEKDILVH